MDVYKNYIEFLRYCLDSTAEEPRCISFINCQELLSFAKKQTIVGLYWQGIQKLPADCKNKPSEDEIMEWMGEYARIVRRNAKVNDAVVRLNKFLKNNKIGFFIFKGQTIAQYYSVPESRTSGDVDFYVFRKDRESAIELLSKKVCIENTLNLKHVEFNMNGIPFELHTHTAVFPSGGKQDYWDDMIDGYFSDILDHVEINGESVPTLPPTVNAIYLFIHIYHHFLKEGIALRQFFDWMMFLQAKHSEIVVMELTAKLNRLGLTRAFKAFGAVLVDVLGMDKSYFPFELTDSDKKYVHKIMDVVLRYGNFGKYGRKEQQSGWKHSLETGIRSVKHIIKFFWLSPSENLLWLPKLIKQSLYKNIK